jgi:hypothetical protein
MSMRAFLLAGLRPVSADYAGGIDRGQNSLI